MNRRIPSVLLILLAASLQACGDGSTSGPAAGAAADAAASRGLSSDRALLSIPTAGGQAALHPLSDPGRELWRGNISLPPAERAVSVAPRLVAIRGDDGTVHRYDPAEGAVSELGELAGDAMWQSGDEGGVWIRRDGDEGGTLWTLSTEGGERRAVERTVTWAAPAADGATVALLGDGPATLVRWPAGADEPDASLELPAGPPAVITAWGRTVVLTRADEAGVLQTVAVEEMEQGDRIDVDGPVTALTASPSSHELYVGVDDPPRFLVVERFGGEVRTRARFDRPIREIRPGVAGGPPVVRAGETAFLVPWAEGEPVRLETSWRPDLPISLPDGSVLVVRDGAVSRTLAGGADGSSAGPADRIWVPVRWRSEAEGTGAAEGTAAAAAAATARDTATADQVAGDTAGGAGRAAARRDSAVRDSTVPGSDLEVSDAGFYVVLGWSRSPAGIRERLRAVRTAGFPVAVQTRCDDAGTEWYRGLVGPYSRRGRAEQVARTLQREQSVEGWVEEVHPGLFPDEVCR